MTKREEERLNALLAKKEKEEKEDKEFFAKVRKRKKEVLKVLDITIPSYTETKMDEIAEKYGLDRWELMEYFDTDQQISYYKRTHIKDMTENRND